MDKTTVRLKKHLPIALGILLMIAWMFYAIFSLLSGISRAETTAYEYGLSEIMNSNEAEVEMTFSRYKSTLSIVATAIEKYDAFTSPEVLTLLADVAKHEGYERLAIDFADGTSYTSDGYQFDITHLGYMDKIRAGEPFILDVMDALTNGIPIVCVFVPLHNGEGEPVAALRCAIATTKLTEVFEQLFVDIGGYFCLVDGNGRYVAYQNISQVFPVEGNYFDVLENITYEKGFSSEQIRKDFTDRKRGYSKYLMHGEQRYSYYVPVGINNWVLSMILPKEIMEEQTFAHTRLALSSMAQIVCILLIIIVYVYLTQRKARNQAVLNEKCFKVLAEQTGKVIFEWDFKEGKITSMSNFKALFGPEATTQIVGDASLTVDTVHSQDQDAFKSIFNTIARGRNVTDARFRVVDVDGEYHWCSLSGVIIRDSHGKPFKYIGSLENIDERIQMEESLKQKAEQDQLTGLYNKATTEHLIKGTLKTSTTNQDKHALMIIDVDNFKSVNDKLGHLYGDIVLSQLADALKPLFRTEDIIGRVGGDEFFVFLKNYKNIGLVETKASEICKIFRNTFTENDVSVSISASLGIALCPENGMIFDELYKSADIALYNAKAGGKNNFTIYNGYVVKTYESNRTEIDTHGSIQKSFKDNRIEYIFKLLYGSENTVASVHSVLQLITEHFGFSRGYIFENSEDGQFTSNTFEWCNEGIPAEIHNLQNVPIGAIATAMSSFKKTGMFVLSSIYDLPPDECAVLEPQGIKSMFQFGIKEGKVYTGFIGFDDCTKERVPTDVEIDEICTICHVLATFLVKQRSTEREQLHYEAIEAIMDNLDSITYVIDQESYTVLYENRNLLKITGSPAVGLKCYEVYRGNASPCENCPMSGLSDTVDRCTMVVYNEKYKLHIRAGATWIKWTNRKKACLVNNIDITEYHLKNKDT